MADERAAQIELPLDLETLGFESLRCDLAQDDLLGEVLRSDSDRVAGATRRECDVT